MTATRMTGRWGRAATIAAVAGLWLFAAALLWRTRVPGDLRPPELDPAAFFSVTELTRAERYERFLLVNVVLSLLAQLGALVFFARRGPRFARESAAGPIGTGMLLGMLTLAVVWLTQLPFQVTELWWMRRHGVSRQDYLSWLLEVWLGLGGQFLFISFAILIVMALARLLRRRWWVVAAPAFAALSVLFALVSPYFLTGLHSLRDPALARDARSLARREGVPSARVEVQEVHRETTAANAEATGLGPTRRVILWDTLLDGRFPRSEVRVVLAHEFAHLARSHIWKGVAWFGLFALPGTFLIARAIRRRGGLADPANVPLALLVLVVLQVVSLPAVNLISRRYEAEADWIALQTTRDPAAARGLFRRFGVTSLADPRPATWSYVLFETHPTLIQRIAMVEAWRARVGRSAAPAGF